jgi:methyl-accepting chemotaxis protein
VQIDTAVPPFYQTAQQNAALVEEAAAAASSLHDQADRLMRSVAAFKTSVG